MPAHPRLGQFASRAKAHVEENVLCTRAAARFMSGAMDQRRELNTRSNVECADAFRAIEFVARHRQEIDTQLSHLGRDLSH